MSVKRYTMPEPSDGRGRAPQPEGSPIMDILLYCEYVLFSDHDAAIAALEDALAIASKIRSKDDANRIASLEARNEALTVALTEISKDNFLYRSTQIAIKALAADKDRSTSSGEGEHG